MKLLGRQPRAGEAGSVQLVAEEIEDVWHAYHLVREGDQVTATTFRKVVRESATSDNKESEKVKIKITITVESIDFDPDGLEIRLNGRNQTQSEHIKLGAYHTLEVELHRPFTVTKEAWDKLDLLRVKQATDPAASADLAVLLITEGLANLLLLGTHSVTSKSKIEASVPSKGAKGAKGAFSAKAVTAFYNKAFAAVVRHVDWDVVKCLVLAGPGTTKDEFRKHLELEAARQNVRSLILNKPKILVAAASSAERHSLPDVLDNPSVAGQIKDTKAAKELAALKDWHTMNSRDATRAFYGPGHVFAAAELGAVATLLLSDTLFHANTVEKRKKWAGLVSDVEDMGGQAIVFAGAHVAGEQLNLMTGVAAILRFPLPDLAEQELVMEV